MSAITKVEASARMPWWRRLVHRLGKHRNWRCWHDVAFWGLRHRWSREVSDWTSREWHCTLCEKFLYHETITTDGDLSAAGEFVYRSREDHDKPTFEFQSVDIEWWKPKDGVRVDPVQMFSDGSQRTPRLVLDDMTEHATFQAITDRADQRDPWDRPSPALQTACMKCGARVPMSENSSFCYHCRTHRKDCQPCRACRGVGTICIRHVDDDQFAACPSCNAGSDWLPLAEHPLYLAALSRVDAIQCRIEEEGAHPCGAPAQDPCDD